MIPRVDEGRHGVPCQVPPGQKHVVILGGGFGGVHAAIEFEKTLARDSNVTVTLVNRENFFLFTPMLHEVASGDLDMTHIVNPIRKLLRRVEFFHGEVKSIDLVQRQIQVSTGKRTTGIPSPTIIWCWHSGRSPISTVCPVWRNEPSR